MATATIAATAATTAIPVVAEAAKKAVQNPKEFGKGTATVIEYPAKQTSKVVSKAAKMVMWSTVVTMLIIMIILFFVGETKIAMFFGAIALLMGGVTYYYTK